MKKSFSLPLKNYQPADKDLTFVSSQIHCQSGETGLSHLLSYTARPINKPTGLILTIF